MNKHPNNHLLQIACAVVFLTGCAHQPLGQSPVTEAPSRIVSEGNRLRMAKAVRIEAWTGCLCGGNHRRTYEELKKERAKRMVFGEDFVIAPEECHLDPVAFLLRHVHDGRQREWVSKMFKGVIYELTEDGTAYLVSRRNTLPMFTVGSLKPGDVFICYQEVY